MTKTVFVIFLSFVFPWSVSAQGKIVIKIGTIAPEGSTWHDVLLEIREQWRRLSGERVEPRIYPGGVLGDEGEMVRKVQRRSLDGVAVSGPGLTRIRFIRRPPSGW